MGNPWEIVRNDVSYPVKFYGKVVTGSDGRQRWIGGEDIVAVAYDVPIPGYKTKTTINLRLWSTKVPSEDLDLCAFNSGEHTKACEAQLNAEKVILISSSLSRQICLISLCFKTVLQFCLCARGPQSGTRIWTYRRI